MNKAHIQLLKENYEKACNAYLEALLQMWEFDKGYGFWIGDDVGGTYAYGDYTTVGMDEIIYCVENGISNSQYNEWLDYNVEAEEFGFNHVNIRAWFGGAPRLSKEQIDNLREKRDELSRLCEEYKNNTTYTDF